MTLWAMWIQKNFPGQLRVAPVGPAQVPNPKHQMTFANPAVAGLAELERMVDLYAQGREELSGKDQEIAELRAEVKALEEAAARTVRNRLPDGLAEEIFVQYPDVEAVEWGHLDDARRDSTGLFFGSGAPYVAVRWCGDGDSTSKATQSSVLESFLRVRLDAPSLVVVLRK